MMTVVITKTGCEMIMITLSQIKFKYLFPFHSNTGVLVSCSTTVYQAALFGFAVIIQKPPHKFSFLQHHVPPFESSVVPRCSPLACFLGIHVVCISKSSIEYFISTRSQKRKTLLCSKQIRSNFIQQPSEKLK